MFIISVAPNNYVYILVLQSSSPPSISPQFLGNEKTLFICKTRNWLFFFLLFLGFGLFTFTLLPRSFRTKRWTFDLCAHVKLLCTNWLLLMAFKVNPDKRNTPFQFNVCYCLISSFVLPFNRCSLCDSTPSQTNFQLEM